MAFRPSPVFGCLALSRRVGFFSTVSQRIAVALAMVLLLGIPSLTSSVMAQDTIDEDEPVADEKPLVVVAAAGIDRILDDVGYVFEAAERPEVFEEINNRLDEIGNLAGFDRTKPMGLMVYLGSGFPPTPQIVGFLPVDNMDDVARTLELGPVIVSKVPGDEGRYELSGPRNTFYIQLQGGFAFISNEEDALVREFPDPVFLTKSQVTQFDLSVNLNLEAIPKLTRSLVVNMMTAGISSQIQQRDDEPDGVYRMRKANGDRTLESIKQILDECQSMTIGMNADAENREATIQLVIDAVAGSKLYQEIFDSTTKPSYFTGILDDSAPLSFSMSTVMVDRDREMYHEMIEGLKLEIHRNLNQGLPGEELPDGPIKAMLDSIRDTTDEGHIDMFLQIFGDPSETDETEQKFVIVGAVRVLDGDAVGVGLNELLNRVGEIDEVRENGDLQLNYSDHQGISFHRIGPKDFDGDVPVLGEEPALYVGAGQKSIWFAVGGERTMDQVREVMDRLAASQSLADSQRLMPNFRAIVNVNEWLALVKPSEGAGGPDESLQAAAESGDLEEVTAQAARRQRRRERNAANTQMMKEVLAEGDDRIEIDFRPTESGGRMQIRFEEGFIRILGRLISQNFEDN